MPVYLCQPGTGATDPWKHGIQVYAAPFAMDEAADTTSGDREMSATTTATNPAANWDGNGRNLNTPSASQDIPGEELSKSLPGVPIRRVRHSEVVLVDDVCVAFDRYWLRLRWPGTKGGFAGYIALGKTDEPVWIKREPGPQGMCIFCFERKF
jgi:hypothetical protein